MLPYQVRKLWFRSRRLVCPLKLSFVPIPRQLQFFQHRGHQRVVGYFFFDDKGLGRIVLLQNLYQLTGLFRLLKLSHSDQRNISTARSLFYLILDLHWTLQIAPRLHLSLGRISAHQTQDFWQHREQ